ncbi:MAG: hypothetical protein WC374_02965 [Phycisphaerae bacterium]|jgi:hypothetical protein
MKYKKLQPIIPKLLFIVMLCVLCLDSKQTYNEKASQKCPLIDMSLEELMEVQIMCDSESTNPSADIYHRWTGQA